MFKFVIFIALWFASSAYATDAVIIHSTVESLPKGHVLAENALVNLGTNTEMTVAFATGGIQTLKGPYRGRLTDPLQGQQPADTALITGLVQLISQENKTAQRGEARGKAALWSVDIDTHRRYYCVPSSQQITLSRPADESKMANTLLITHKESADLAQLTWPARQTTLTWPENLPPNYGDTYTLKVNSVYGQEYFKILILYRLPDSLPTESHKVIWMAGRGCIPQAEMLLASLR